MMRRPGPEPERAHFEPLQTLCPLRGHPGRSEAKSRAYSQYRLPKRPDYVATAQPTPKPLETSGPRLSLRSAGVTLKKIADPRTVAFKWSQDLNCKPQS